MNPANRSSILAAMAVVAIALALTGAAIQPAAAAAAAGPATYRAIYFFAADIDLAISYQEWLAGEGYELHLWPLLEPEQDYRFYLPLVFRNSTGAALEAPRNQVSERNLVSVGSGDQPPDLSAFDLFFFGPDTGSQELWMDHQDLLQAIASAQRPVVVLGEAAMALSGLAGLPQPSLVAARAGQVADPGLSAPIWNGARPVPRDEAGVARLYRDNVPTVVMPLDEPLPEGIRVASLPGQPHRISVLVAAQRAALWGYGGPAQALTEAGRNLFLNLLDFFQQDLQMPLRSRPFTPPAGVEDDFAAALAQARAPLHALVQLWQPIDLETRAALEGKGVALSSYLDGLNYLGLVQPGADLDDPELRGLARWIGLYRPGDRTHPDVTDRAFAPHNLLDDGRVKVTVVFFPEVPPRQVYEIFERLGCEILSERALNTWTVELDPGQLDALSAEEAVQWIEQAPGPARRTNDGARFAIGTDQVVQWNTATAQARGPDGSGVRAAVFEGDNGYTSDAVDYQHADFGSRVVYTYTNDFSDHTTHVAGIIGGDGGLSAANGGAAEQWRGHAPGVDLISVPYGWDTNLHYFTAINSHGADLSNHSYIMEDVVYSALVAGVDSLVRGDESHSGTAIPARLVVWASANEGWDNQHTNEEGFFSCGAPAKNALTVGSVDSNNNLLSGFSSRGPTFDNRIKPDVVAPGCQVGGDGGIRSTVADIFTNWWTLNCDGTGDDYCWPYDVMCGTSMAAPATTGALSLALEEYFALSNTTSPPRPATLKGLAIHTADDLQHDFAAGGQTWNCADLCQADQTASSVISPTCAVQYGAGPDYSTGYGLINVPRLVEQVEHKGYLEDSVSPTNITDTYTIPVLAGRTEIKFTLVWDDEPGSSTPPETNSKLVNDLDLTLTDPSGVVYLPWILDPLTPTSSPGGGGFDPVTRANLTAARRGVDRRNNVEQVSVVMGGGLPTGDWTVHVVAHSLPTLKTQTYSLIGDYRRLTITGAQSLTSTGFPVNAGPTAQPDKVLVRVKIENPKVSPGYTQNYEKADFKVELGKPSAGEAWQNVTVLSAFQVGSEVAIDIRPPSGLNAGSKYDLRVTLIGIDDDVKSEAVKFVKGTEVAGYWLTDSSGSMGGGKIVAAKEAGKSLVDLLRNDDWVGAGRFQTTEANLMDVTKVTGAGQLTTAKNHIGSLTAGGGTAMGPGMDLARQKLDTASLPANIQEVVFLLSDGMENTTKPVGASPPTVGCWDNHKDEEECKDNPPYVKTNWPSDIQAYVVCLGQAGAAWHSFCDQVAKDTAGPAAWHVYETPKTGATTAAAPLADPLFPPVSRPADSASQSAAAALADLAETAPSAENLAALLEPAQPGEMTPPTTLPVRLEDAYLDMGQLAHRWPRMFEWASLINPQMEYVAVEFDVEENLPAMYVTQEWDEARAAVDGMLYRPDGSPVDPSDGDVIYYRQDDTHQHWGLREPQAATWRLEMMAHRGEAEVLVTVSGPSDIGMRLLIDPDAQGDPGRFVYEEIEICTLLTDNSPISGSQQTAVAANVIDPAATSHWMWLLDDGFHEDGAAGDGIFCDRFRGVDLPGVYQIKALAKGVSNDGRNFVRRAMGYTYRKPQALFVYREAEIARPYQELFDDNGIRCDAVHVQDLGPGREDLSLYDLIVIGPHTGEGEDWGTREALEILVNAQRPTVGLAEGGQAFYGQLGLFIGFPNSRPGAKNDVYALDPSHDIWQLPHDLRLGRPTVDLYERTRHVAVRAPDWPDNVEPLGREVDDTLYYPIIHEIDYQWNERGWEHCLWGYSASPAWMTEAGRKMFFNVAWYMMR